ncbi:hypothetical protein QQS21_008923 [Conoideocrella luteorostrata]|uniref:Uncharacterized protein n=1 Tax=Conoideocrella luteorostrata TaxID=1105319 RepID=A0AAJ0CKP6_9HYPO|nr:hypothetical protein QQS21_008923 [Conoideocrella luteorostrata]
MSRIDLLCNIAMKQYAKSLKFVMDMIQSDRPLSYSDKATILTTNFLFVLHCAQQNTLPESLLHLMNGFKLIQHWRFWEPPLDYNASLSSSSSSLQPAHSALPNMPVLSCYIQTEEGMANDMPAASSWAWQWEHAVFSVQKRPFISLSDAHLEIEMIWIGARSLVKRMPLKPNQAEVNFLEEKRMGLCVYTQNWAMRLGAFQASHHISESDNARISILKVRKILLDVLLSVDVNQFEICWDAFQPQFERAILLVEALLHKHEGDHTAKPEHVEPYSLLPILTNSLHYICRVCRCPSLRRRAIALLKEQQRTERIFGVLGGLVQITQSAEMMMHLEERAWVLGRNTQDDNLECICLAGKYICSNHRVFELNIDHSRRVFSIRTVGDIVQNRPAQTVALTDLFPT